MGDALAMRVIARVAEAMRADGLVEIESAHVDGGLDHGEAGLAFAERLRAGGARVRVPTTLNVGSLDLLHPHLYRGDDAVRERSRSLMDCYVELGCEPTWTCAPYQLPTRPHLGQRIAWAESNAIVFANSVLGARTNRLADFVDICAAVTGRVPDYGLYRTENRRGQIVFRLDAVPAALREEELFYPVLGYVVGAEAGSRVPVIDGLPPDTSEDRLKALGAAAASSGSVALFHAVGVTPEAPTLDAALQGRPAERELDVTPALLARAREALAGVHDGPIAAVSLGTPHFSVTEFEQLVALVERWPPRPEVDVYVSTGRHVLAAIAERGWVDACERAGVQIVVDTCTYVTPILRPAAGVVMTNSAKWAHYAPGNLGVEVAFGSMRECVRSAHEGRVWRDAELWDGA